MTQRTDVVLTSYIDSCVNGIGVSISINKLFIFYLC